MIIGFEYVFCRARYADKKRCINRQVRSLCRQPELADIQTGAIKGFDQIERGEFSEGSGKEAIERSFTHAAEQRGL